MSATTSRRVWVFTLLFLACAGQGAMAAKGPLRASRENPRYFADPTGRIVYLTGSHTWASLQDMGITNPPPAFDFTGYLDVLEGTSHYEWFNPATGLGAGNGRFEAPEGKREFKAPFEGESVLYLGAAPLFPATGTFPGNATRANQQSTNQSWWLAKGLRVVTYEFLERSGRTNDLSAEEILGIVDRFGGCDLVLIKGFHYWKGGFDDSSWGYARFHRMAEKLIPKLHARGIKAGIFGFLERRRAYGGGPDHGRVMDAWNGYVNLGADILFIDEESGGGELDVPASCLVHCDELRETFKLPVGLFLYGPASKAQQVRSIAQHVDVIGEMDYTLSLQAHGDYGLEEVTREWSQALNADKTLKVAYWTGAMVMSETGRQPGSAFWRERFGERSLSGYFEDYFHRARASGADGIFFHSLCRLTSLPEEAQTEVAASVKRVFQAENQPTLRKPQ